MPATSALVIAVSTIRSVDERTVVARLDRGGEIGAEPVLEHGSCPPLWQPCGMGLTRAVGGVLGAGAVAGAGLTAYAAWEARQYTLRRVEVPLLPPGARPVRVLHLSDLHLTPGQRRKQEWVSGLSTLRPDLVINTGDNLAHAASVPVVRDALGPLLDAPGVFVFGSNDYFSPTLRNPLRYLLPDDGTRQHLLARGCRGPSCATSSPPPAGST